ncbi:MAG: 16S rRNA (adenine(1518)-N(6)/adenine(1519)-N(6))-dimethyltransferase RsmA [Bacilli bacterium]|nr:16S rRNA (adenine(1518)-N(6)/adenine(1519)-N(6))-dimethyltransferase RsmA [Bacilli bacterium]
MEINRNNINKIMMEYYVKPDKDYGQNFLVEPSVCEKITDLLEIQKEDKVLEIGPGIGSLTHFLSLKSDQLSIVDIDMRMIDFLKEKYRKSNIEFINNDIRKTDISNYEKIIGNLPYNITTEAITYILLNARLAKRVVIMCQSEAFNHFNDIQGKEYGPASVLLHLVGTCNKKFTVKPGSFYPAPKCTSTVFTIDFNKNIEWETMKKVYLFAKQLFLNRRKTIYNNLSQYLKDKEKASKALESLGITPNTRPEEISPERYLDLYKEIA